MCNYLEYQKSISHEFQAYKNRVRYMIGNIHWGEDGRYKEIILINFLRRILPKTVSVGTGFIRNGKETTSQIDIIVYSNNIPLLFSEGDFIIASPENVIAIIEVKSTAYASKINEIINKANENGFITCKNHKKSIFNGIFAYDLATSSISNFISHIKKLDYSDFSNITNQYKSYNERNLQCVNHMVLGNKNFIKYFPTGNEETIPTNNLAQPYYGFYDMYDELAITYFISNLQEYVLSHTLPIQTQETCSFYDLHKFFYPITDGKESRLIDRVIM